VDPNAINVEVKDGQVRLSGTVPVWAGVTAARTAASYAPGVKEVITDLMPEGAK
jgi:osmotically-inducible protein OsmY